MNKHLEMFTYILFTNCFLHSNFDPYLLDILGPTSKMEQHDFVRDFMIHITLSKIIEERTNFLYRILWSSSLFIVSLCLSISSGSLLSSCGLVV